MLDAIIVGAGPAGLAVGACLRRQQVPFLMLEQADNVAATWRRHYDRLHLHTPKALSALPFFPFPSSYPRYPSRLQVISYLEAYAQHFALAPTYGQHVVAARPTAGGWEVRTQDSTYEASTLVVATGQAREPYGLQRPAYGPLQQIEQHARIPLIDVGTIDLIRQGAIAVYSGVASFSAQGVTFADGRQAAFDAVILATGYRPRVNTFLQNVAAAYDEEGSPLTSGQEVAAGLYFCGFHVSTTGMLRQIAGEACRIAAAMKLKGPQQMRRGRH